LTKFFPLTFDSDSEVWKVKHSASS
jgi:hypothetical protein